MKQIVCTVLLSLAAFSCFAQEVYSSTGKPVDEKKEKLEEEKGFNRDKLIFGGGFIFGIGGGVTNLGLSPVIGYRITDKFSAGIGLGYQYLRINNYTQVQNPVTGALDAYNFKTSIFSGSVWARHILWQNIFVHVEPEINTWNDIQSISYDMTTNPPKFVEQRNRVIVPSLLVGGGLRQPISERVSFVGMILYDVLQDPKSPYNGIALRFGIVAGF